MKKVFLQGLTEEQIAKIKECKNQEELLKLAKEEGVELSEEQLQAVSGGMCSSTEKGPVCPHCQSSDTVANDRYGSKSWPSGEYQWYCKDCMKYFN